MKARAIILPTTQLPFTVLGLLPKVLALVLVVACLTAATTVMLGIGQFAMFVVLGVAAPGLAWAFRAGRAEPHLESVFVTSLRFWNGKKTKTLLAGEKDEFHE